MIKLKQVLKSRFGFYVLIIISLLVVFGGRNTIEHAKKQVLEHKVPNQYWLESRSGPEYNFDHDVYFKAMADLAIYKRNRIGNREGDLDQEWKLEGPENISGRINAIASPSIGSDTIYVGATNGGVFKTIDGGKNWSPTFDYHAYMSIGAIAVDGPNVYVGTGDRNMASGAHLGNGVHCSSDHGNTWKNIGPLKAGVVTDICLHPTNKKEIVIGSLGTPYAKTKDRGIFRTTDGGNSWQNTLFISDTSGVCNLIRDPNNSEILFCASYNRFRPDTRSYFSGPDAKIFKSTDGGITWNQLTNGLPTGTFSRTGIAIAKTNSDILYCVFLDEKSNLYEIYKTTDAGNSWTGLNAGNNSSVSNAYNGYGWYFGTIFINPFDENHVVLPGFFGYHSEDGGITWSLMTDQYSMHVDNHAIQFLDKNSLIIATDGGLYKTTNRGDSWSDIEDLPITQFYDITAASHMMNGLYAGGTQDNGVITGNQNGLLSWSGISGEDGFEFTPTNSGYDITESQRANIILIHDNGNWEPLQFDQGETRPWFTPYEFDTEKEQIVVGTDRIIVFENPPNGRKILSKNLTRVGTEGKTSRGRDISEIELDPSNQDHLLVGTSDGLVWKGSVSAGMGNWVQINDDWGQNQITSVNHSVIDKNTYFVALTGYENPFMGSSIYKTTDGGESWNSISGNIPAIGVNDLLIPENGQDQIIFAATDGGVFLTQDGGTTWGMVGTNIPSITVSEVDLDLVNEKLIAGTYGRSMWSYDVTFLELDQVQVGIKDHSANFYVYPNPANTKLHVGQIESFSNLQIFNANGQQVETIATKPGQTTIDLSKWKKGMYTIKNETHCIKLLKK